MKLKALTIFNELINFTLEDCPVYVSKATIALAAREMSILIKAESVVRGDDESGIFEGDRVYMDGEYIGNVIYSSGFMVQNLDGTLKSLTQMAHIKIETGTSKSIKTVCEDSRRTPLLFKCKDSIIQLNLFLCKLDNSQIAVFGNSYSDKILNCEDVQFYTGIKLDGEAVFYGDVMNNGKVVLYNLQPCIRCGNIYRRLSDERSS